METRNSGIFHHVVVDFRVVAAVCCAGFFAAGGKSYAADPSPDPITAAAELPPTLPWDLVALSRPPAVEWLDTDGPVRSLLYAGEPFRGRPTRVFAYYATPASIGGEAGGEPAATQIKGPWPGIVLVHGGGGTAFSEWVTLWARRGYAAIAMDLAGSRPDTEATKPGAVVRLPDGGPGQSHDDTFDTLATPAVDDDWPYHAVANVIRVHSLLRSLPDVDPNRTAITGISWGGYTTCPPAAYRSSSSTAPTTLPIRSTASCRATMTCSTLPKTFASR